MENNGNLADILNRYTSSVLATFFCRKNSRYSSKTTATLSVLLHLHTRTFARYVCSALQEKVVFFSFFVFFTMYMELVVAKYVL